MSGAAWRALGTDVHVLVSDPRALREAAAVVDRQLTELDECCSRFRDSELTRLRPGRQRVGSVLAGALSVALTAAEVTDGLVDPTLGRALVMSGYDRTFAAVPAHGPGTRPGPCGRWREVQLDGDLLDLPDVELDLGATAKAWAADRAAATVAERLDVDVLVNVGGDIAVAGGSWPVAVGDPGGPSEVVEVASALATSSTARRTWQRGGRRQHHVLDPRTGSPAPAYWQTVTVAAATCVEANTASTAAVVLGPLAPVWLGELPVRLVDAAGRVTYGGGWAA
jgi:thiamine biosynthesis lipoprotein